MKNNKNCELWADALRSGAYKQSFGLLEKQTLDGTVLGNCCLGVACRVYEKQTGEVLAGRPNIHNTYFRIIPFDGSIGLLPRAVKHWLDIDDCFCGKLVKMNDNLMNNFNQIADFIEKNA